MSLIALLIALAPAPVSCIATDGDSLRCGEERVRLIGIDAPELHGCRHGRKCVEGDPHASLAALRAAIGNNPVRLERHGKDRFGRTLAFAFVGEVNLSCHQLRQGGAVYKPEWDVDGVAGQCR